MEDMREILVQALKTAVKQQEKRRIATFRLIQAAIKDRDIAHRGQGKDPVTSEEIMEILTRMVKQRKESALAYTNGNRMDLANEENEEIKIIQEYLPQPLSEEEMQAACAAIVEEIGAEGLKDLGRTMNALKEKYAGRMDFARASALVKAMLA